MSSTPSTSANQSSQSSGSEKTPDSGTSRTKRANSSKSPTLQAFHSFDEPWAQFLNHVLTRIDHIGHDNVDTMKVFLEVLDNKCENMKNQFKDFISSLDKAIERYETKKPTDLAADAKNVISPKEPARNRSSSFKGNQTIEEMFAALNQGTAKIYEAIEKKIDTSTYEDYSISMEKKLKRLKVMCEDKSHKLEQIGKTIKGAIEKNEGLSRSNDA
ncbi:uncharacterized protein LOC129572351 [Sitodiplosis mosellana]|uniref:uncharacterized protein LOC129572351 n=1 Tax=Sitodiplosis mosellana TaxID=263140 RepID=UPI002443AD3E|nr:uncharacterized protein LOC129572351 [Sitodiplosis mosellana]